MNILVTGSEGFVGSHMLRYLEQSTAARCYGLDYAAGANQNTLSCDLSDPAAVDRIIRELAPDLVFHMAGSFSNDFDTDFRSNVLCAKNILDAMVNRKLSGRVLLMGSAAEYGEISADENPVAETRALRPISAYGWSKAAQTQLASLYASTHGINVCVARTFNLKGKGMSDKLFVGRVEQQIRSVLSGINNRISVGDTTAQRDYIDIDDACPMYHLVATHGKPGEVYNVGSGKAVTMKSLLLAMLEQAGLKDTIIDEQGNGKLTPHSQVSVIYADTDKLNRLRDQG